MTGGLLWGAGVFLASFSAHKLWWLYLTYGVIGGTGLGMGYIVPISVLVKWFPDRRGLITGIAVGGFGAGSLIAAPAAHRLIEHVGVLPTFAYLGIAYAIVAIASASFMQNPPDGWKPEGWAPSASQISQRCDRDYTLGEALGKWQWWALCLLMSINTMAGLSIVSQAAPIFQEMGKASAAAAAGLGGRHQHRKRVGPHFLGLDFRPHHPQDGLFPDVSGRGVSLLDLSQHFFDYDSCRRHVYPGDVLRRRVRDHAGVCRRLFRPPPRRPDFRFDDASLGLCVGVRPFLFAYLRQITGTYTQGSISSPDDDRLAHPPDSRVAAAQPHSDPAPRR